LSNAYRADIDGLRALCILPVVLFHGAVPYFEGGFVGVDSFFVISGYLITTLIASDITDRKFSFGNFYRRRARRLLPALLFLYAAILVFSLAYYTPASLHSNLQQISASILLFSNFFYLERIDYFAGDNLSFMLLHTWSLSIEEQFYLVFPAALTIAMRTLGRSRAAVALLILTVASFLYSCYLAHWAGESSGAYYHSLSRFWQLVNAD
tara:strand:+ start:33790 stop:34416 length:627 start_codon:yes stop_codon:yes gene_type:complete